MIHPRFSYLMSLCAALCFLGEVACVSGGRRRAIPKRLDFAAPLDALKSAYPVLTFPEDRREGPGRANRGNGGQGLRQTPVLEAALLFKAWGAPNVVPEEAGFPASATQGSVVWVWQFYDKRVIARGQVWPIRKSKPYVEKIEVQLLRSTAGSVL